MNFLAHIPLLAQASPDDVVLELARLQRNFDRLSWGFLAAWLILTLLVLMMIGREGKLKRQIASLKAMLEERQKK